MPLMMMAQGWPDNYGGVMLQGFYWDSYSDSKWTKLESQADELSQYFDLIWVPQSGWCNSSNSMGYNDIYWYNQRSAFGTEDELKSMISTFKAKGTGIIADVVINHRGGVSRWTDFPTETNPLDGKEYSMGLSDICSTDEYNTDASAATERSTYGKATGAKDTGDDFNGCRDLDHTSTNVQENCKAYTKYLLEYLGYTGFRYDMVKGYSAKYVGMYNAYSSPTYSVAECWDGISTIKTWINGTKTDGEIQSGAFDFPAKYLMTNNPKNYGKWYNASDGLAFNDTYKQYGITFVDNHDTYRDEYGSGNTFTGDIAAANAWILAIPGTPCVFLPHWQAYKSEIAAMIKVRKAVGITNTSAISKIASSTTYLVAEVTGTNGKLYVIVGSESAARSNIPSGYTKVIGGDNYAYYTDVAVEGFMVDKQSGKYDDQLTVTITPVGNSTIVYTTDGTEPTATNGTQVSGEAKSLTFTTSTTLKVGVLSNGKVKDVETYSYEVAAFEPYKITVYVNCPEWDPLYFYAWNNNSSDNQLLGSWPGTKATQSKTIGDETWYYQEFDITASDYVVNFIFNNGNGKPQTVNIEGLNTDKYFKLGDKEGTNYGYKDVTSEYDTGISSVVVDDNTSNNPVKVYSINGVLVRSLPAGTSVGSATNGLAKGLYIVNGKKILAK